MKYPLFLSIEGVDKAGKTTLIQMLNKYQHLINWDSGKVVFTHEPGGSDNLSAEKLRSFILNNDFDVLTQAYLFAASRNEHIIHTIKPNLALGNIVISDRFVDSSYVYQGLVGGLGIETVQNINKYALNDIMPQLTIVLVVPVNESIKRIKEINDPDDINLFDEKVYMQKAQEIYDGYLTLKKLFPKRIHLIDGTSSPKEIMNNVINVINDFLEENA